MAGFEGILTLLALFGAKGSGAGPAPSSAPMPGPMPGAGPPDTSAAPAPAPSAVPPMPAPSAAPPIATALPTLPWPTGPVPATLPPFPGPGWEPDTPVTNEIAARATYWNALLWDFPTKTMRKPYVQENFGGQWITWSAAWHPGDKGPQTYMATEAWRVKTPAAVPIVMPTAAAPMPAPMHAAAPAAAPAPMPTAFPPPGAPLPTIPAVQPYPGPGAWHTNAVYIRRLQTALTAIGFSTGGIDGKDGPKTQAAVKAFQKAHGLTQDGQAGANTAAAIDAQTGASPGVHGMSTIGWNLFHAIAHAAQSVVHTFQHIAHDLGPVGIALGASLGLPPEIMATHGGLALLIMQAHAGHPDAKAKVAKIAAKGGAWSSFIAAMQQHLQAHPDFAAFHAHAQAGHAAAHASNPAHAAPHVVGWNLFHAIAHAAEGAVHTFQHIAHDLGPVGIALGASVGLPPEVLSTLAAHGGAVALLMNAHAGHPDAKRQLATLSAAHGHPWDIFVSQMTQHMHAHPDFAAFHAHAQAGHAAAHAAAPHHAAA